MGPDAFDIVFSIIVFISVFAEKPIRRISTKGWYALILLFSGCMLLISGYLVWERSWACSFDWRFYVGVVALMIMPSFSYDSLKAFVRIPKWRNET